jgi:hypothetical protein
MTTSNTLHPSSPECARYTTTLPQLRQGTLAPAEVAALSAHLATCAYCRARLGAYDSLDAALVSYLRHFAPTTPDADDLVEAALEAPRNESMMANMDADTVTDTRDEATLPPIRPPIATRRPPRGSRPHPALPVIAALLLVGLAAALFTMISRTANSPAHIGAATSTVPVATATATLAPSVVNAGHPCSSDNSGQTKYARIGALKVSYARFSLAYPAGELPATLDPAKPYLLPDNLPGPPSLPVNPSTDQGNGYLLTICNTGATSHVIRSLTVGITAFTAFSGPLNTFAGCDGWFQRPGSLTGGGCGGGASLDERLQASFAADATTGVSVTTTQVGTGNRGGNANNQTTPPLPVSLGPGQMLVIGVGVTPPSAPGVYTLAFALNYDDVTAAPISTMQPTLFDSAAVAWNGQNCEAPALLSQIPPNDTAGRYICAPSPA